jgi:hypothetical protein
MRAFATIPTDRRTTDGKEAENPLHVQRQVNRRRPYVKP